MSKIWKAKADAIAKRCPNGYHKDENGNCVDSNGNYYQRKQEQPKQEQPKQTEIPSNFDPSKLSEKEKKKIFSSHKSYRGKAYNALSNLYTALNIANSKNDKEYDEFRNEIAHTNPENICDNYEKYVSRWNKINSNSKYDSEFKRGMNETKYSPLEYLKSIKQYVENERKYSKLSHLILDYEQSKRKNAGKSTNKSKMKKNFDPSLNTMYEVQHTDYDVPNYAISPNVGDVFINPNGVELKITNISLTSDGTPQIAYNNSSKGYEECYDLDRFRNILHAGYFVKKSTKKSYTPNYQDFRSMVKSIKNTGNHNNVFKE